MEQVKSEGAPRKTIVVFAIDEDQAGAPADLTPEQTKDALAELTSAIEGLRTKDTPVEMGKPFAEPFTNTVAVAVEAAHVVCRAFLGDWRR